MKRITILICLSFLFFGCKKVEKLTQFNIDFTEEIEISPSYPLNLPFNLITPNVETNSEAEFAVNNTRKDLVEEIKLLELKLTLNGPSEGNFKFLESIELFLNAEDLPEVRIAWALEIGDMAGKELILETSDNDLKEYIKKDKFTLRVNTVTDEVIDEKHYIEIYSNYFVDAKLIQ